MPVRLPPATTIALHDAPCATSCIAGCASRALESGALPLTSASSCGRQSVNPRAAVISTDRQTEALSDSKFSEGLDGTLGSEKARKGPILAPLG